MPACDPKPAIADTLEVSRTSLIERSSKSRRSRRSYRKVEDPRSIMRQRVAEENTKSWLRGDSTWIAMQITS